jgi:hypothetical protein
MASSSMPESMQNPPHLQENQRWGGLTFQGDYFPIPYFEPILQTFLNRLTQ